jgi:D-arabinan exo alpha-(1,3)/(1,5)-arabinofuranosidase (non-reducing end)
MRTVFRCAIFFFVLIGPAGSLAELPVIPVGWDAYLMWERWPYQRIGVRAYMRSTYDRRGGNEGADASHFLYQLAEDRNVTLDIGGPGILYFARYNHWHGSPWHYEIDGVDHLVQETSTADPNHPVAGSVFLPHKAFPNPLAWTWADTKGADLMWVAISFQKSFRMAYSRTHYGTGYYIYHQFVPGVKLSRPITSWDESEAPNAEVLDLLARAGQDQVPSPESPLGHQLHLTQISGSSLLAPGKPVVLVSLTNAPAMVRVLELAAPRERAIEFGRGRLRIFWDGSMAPSVDTPVALFFGAGTLYNRDEREYLVKAFPVTIRFDAEKVHLACYFPMPFFKSARIELADEAKTDVEVGWSIRYQPCEEPPTHLGYFHATYRDHAEPEAGKDLVLLDTRQTEGGGEWSGQFIGTSLIFSDRAELSTLEGDPRFFFDGSQTPQAYGTGTEEWCGGGDYWGGANMTLPLVGHPTGASSAKAAKCLDDKIESAYRFLLADLMPFGNRAIIRLEHGGQNDSHEHYQTVAYWYGLNRPSLIRTDQLKIGDLESEKAHRYTSPDASAPYTITSRYEWGVDKLNGREIYPAQADTGRKTTGVTEFNLKLAPENLGVLLRRKLDYEFPNQRAEVYVAEVKEGRVVGAFEPAGVWYLAGSRTCVYSNPKEELGTAEHLAQTSNRRFRDDEFLLARALTEGRSEIRVRIRFKPVMIPLFPGAPQAELAWSEMRYDAYCFVMP